jgi:hypothetical protein
MALSPAPIQSQTTNDRKIFLQAWIIWLASVVREVNTISGGTP